MSAQPIRVDEPAVLDRSIAAGADATILGAQRRWADLHRGLADEPEDVHPNDSQIWPAIAAAEEEMRSNVADTPGGIIAKLAVALVHNIGDGEAERAAIAGDWRALLAKEASLDRSDRMILSAITSLEGLQTAGQSPRHRLVDGVCSVVSRADALDTLLESSLLFVEEVTEFTRPSGDTGSKSANDQCWSVWRLLNLAREEVERLKQECAALIGE